MGKIVIESWKNADKDNKFQQREQIGRIKTAALLSQYDDWTIDYTWDDFNRIDAYATATTSGDEYVIEIKDINRDYGKYDDFSIEWSKIEAMHSHNKTGLLICHFTDYQIIWEIDDDFYNELKNRRYNSLCTSTTMNYVHGQVNKVLTRLYLNECKKKRNIR